MKAYQLLSAALLDSGLDVAFGLMGDANMMVLSDYIERGGRFVPVVHEGSSVVAADAHSRFTGTVALATVTHGPGLTNTATALVEAVRNHSQVLLLTGDVPPDPTYFQKFDISAYATMAGAGYERVYSAATVAKDVARALQRIVAERRPVVLDFPKGLVLTEADPVDVPARLATPTTAAAPDPEAVEDALAVILSARRPVVLAGRGAVAAGARDELVALAERLGAPLSTSLLAKDYFAGHPWNIGLCGNLSHSAAVQALADADCVIAFGAALNMFTAFHGEMFHGKKVVQIDNSPAAFGSFTPVTEAVCADARTAATALTALLDEVGHRPPLDWVTKIADAVAAHDPRDDFVDRSGPDRIDPRTAALLLDPVLPRNRVMVSDIGRYVVAAWPRLAIGGPQDFTTMGAFGSIGLGLAAGVGAAVARPDDVTIALIGDGGLMQYLSEFTTAVRERLPLVVLVFNDSAYGAEYFQLELAGRDPGPSRMVWPDLADVARSLGGRGVTVRTADDISDVATALEGLDGPLLVDLRLDPAVNVIDWL